MAPDDDDVAPDDDDVAPDDDDVVVNDDDVVVNDDDVVGDDDDVVGDDDDVVGDDDDATPAPIGCDNPPSDGTDTIYEVQNGSLTGAVSIPGLAITGLSGNGFFAQDPRGGTCSGAWVYVGGSPGLAMSDVVDVQATVLEYYDLTELDASAGLVTPTGNTALITPTTVLMADVQAATAEPWEGVLVQVAGLTVAAEPTELASWEWEVSDGANSLLVDNLLYSFNGATEPLPYVGQSVYLIAGVLNYNWNEFKIAPREYADIAFGP